MMGRETALCGGNVKNKQMQISKNPAKLAGSSINSAWHIEKKKTYITMH